MNKNAESRARRLFAGVNSSLSRTDPEFVEIISNFSQDETANANILTEKDGFYEQKRGEQSAKIICRGKFFFEPDRS